MKDEPVLAIQPRRMGDLILSFSLFSRLRSLYPQNPLLVCAEPHFYKELAPLAPVAHFLPPSRLPSLVGSKFAAIINLSPRDDVASFAGKCQTQTRLGPYMRDGALRVNGFWQLYRMALTRNNQHNTFHWSDLDFLDLYDRLPVPGLPHKKPQAAGKGLAGLFVGASEAGKRPDAQFWAPLARRLSKAGYKPVLLGGKAEIDLGVEIGTHCGPGHVNLCGKLGLGKLAATLASLDLCISPDTGPMHLANQLGVPVLNLSMGNVNAAETGPSSPGQWVLRANMSCVGCWQCHRGKHYCKAAFNPLAVANIAMALLENKPQEQLGDALPPGLELLQTGRDEHGLARLLPLNPGLHAARYALDAFWRSAFLAFAFAGKEASLGEAVEKLAGAQGRLAEHLSRSLGKMLACFRQACARGSALPENFWLQQPAHSRLLAGHIQMELQNSDYSRQSWLAAMDRLAMLANYLQKGHNRQN